MRVLDENNWVLLEPIERTTKSGLVQTEVFIAEVISSPHGTLNGLIVCYNNGVATPYKQYYLVDYSQIYGVIENE